MANDMQSPDGNGRLWERFELANINERIENLYQHFRDEQQLKVDGGDGTGAPLNLEAIRRAVREDISKIMGDLEATYNAKSSLWKKDNVRLKQEVNELQSRLRDVEQDNASKEEQRVQLDARYRSLRGRLDEYIESAQKKNDDRINALKSQLRAMENEKAKLVAEMNANKRQHDEEMNAMHAKYDALNAKYNKASAARSDLQAERDKYLHQFTHLQRVMNEEKEGDAMRENEEMKKLRERLNETQTNYDLLYKKHVALDDDYRVLQDKYSLEKEAFKKAMAGAQVDRVLVEDDKQKSIPQRKHQEEMKNLRLALTREHAKNLEDREKQWEKAKNQSIHTLDNQYKELEGKLIAKITNLQRQIAESKKENEDTVNRFNEHMASKKDELAAKEAEIDRLNADIAEKLKTMNKYAKEVETEKAKTSKLQDAFNEKEDENMKLSKDLGKHQILWHHFFGLDVKLKDVISQINNNLDKFENYHHVESPIPKKRKRVVIESLDQFQRRHPRQCPLLLDSIPAPNDPFQRFTLCNVHNAVIELKGFKLSNKDGDSIALDSRQIKPGGRVGVALKKKKQRFDIGPFPDGEFCTFSDGEVIYLEDSFGEKVQIFPVGEQIVDDLSTYSALNPLIMVHKILNVDSDFRGFEFMNAQNRKLRLKNCVFKNKKGTLEVAVPFKSLPKKGVIRVVVTDDDQHPQLKRNDLRVPTSMLPATGLDDDVLYLCDQYGNMLQLYDMNGSHWDGAGIGGGATGQRSSGSVTTDFDDGDSGSGSGGDHDVGVGATRRKSECFIM